MLNQTALTDNLGQDLLFQASVIVFVFTVAYPTFF